MMFSYTLLVVETHLFKHVHKSSANSNCSLLPFVSSFCTPQSNARKQAKMQKLSEETREFTVTVAVICWVVSTPDPNQPQHGSLPVYVLEAIHAGVGLYWKQSVLGLVWVWGRDYCWVDFV